MPEDQLVLPVKWGGGFVWNKTAYLQSKTLILYLRKVNNGNTNNHEPTFHSINLIFNCKAMKSVLARAQ